MSELITKGLVFKSLQILSMIYFTGPNFSVGKSSGIVILFFYKKGKPKTLQTYLLLSKDYGDGTVVIFSN